MEEPLFITTRGSPGNRALIVFHGRDEDEERSLRIAARIDPEGKYFAIAPRAPHQTRRGRNWFGAQGERGAAMTMELLEHEIAKLIEPSGAQRPIVVGFSEGGGVATALAYRRGGSIDCSAAIILAGFVPRSVRLGGREAPPPALLLHGSQDRLVAASQVKRLASTLQTLRADVTIRRFDGGHWVPTAVLESAAVWLDSYDLAQTLRRR